MNEIVTRFDDHILNSETARIVERRALEIKGLIRRTAQDIIEVGKRLIEVKQLLPHGAFSNWLRSKFDWSERTAQNFMRVAETFKSETVADLNIQPKALYLLSARSTPASARLEAIERAEDGEMISHAKAKAIVTVHKDRPEDDFPIRSQPTAHEPILPRSSTTHSTHSSFGAFLDRIYNEVLTFQNLGRPGELAAPLTVAQRRKLSAIIEFLQSVEFFTNDPARRNGEDWMNGFVHRIQREDF